MMKHAFPQGNAFYKTNLHCHTVISDGALTPEEVKQAYLGQGYAAVAFTDHEVLLSHADLTDADFVALHGYETAIKEIPGQRTGYFQRVFHLNLLARTADNLTQPFLYPEIVTPGNCHRYLDRIRYRERLVYEYSVAGVNDLIHRASEAGFLVSLNHPEWSLTPPALYGALEGLHSIEVCNTASFASGDRTGLPYGEMLRRGKRLLPVGGDDNHNRRGMADSFGAFTMLSARALTYDALIEAYENGWCYASCGPLIEDICMDGESVFVRTSPAASITLLSEGRYTRTVAREGVCEARFPLAAERLGSFFRLVVTDRAGRQAFSRAYFAEEWADTNP